MKEDKAMINGDQGPDEAPIPWDTSENDHETTMVMRDKNLNDTMKFINKSRGGWLCKKQSKQK